MIVSNIINQTNRPDHPSAARPVLAKYITHNQAVVNVFVRKSQRKELVSEGATSELPSAHNFRQ